MRLPENRIGAVCAIAGAFLLLAGTWLHPMPPDPNNAAQAFAAYADDRLWVASHLAQLVGIALALAALVILARQLETGGAAVWARLASAGAIASLALADGRWDRAQGYGAELGCGRRGSKVERLSVCIRCAAGGDRPGQHAEFLYSARRRRSLE